MARYNENLCIFGGTLTKDVEFKFLSSGNGVAEGSIVMNRNYKVGEEWKQEATFVDFKAWDRVAEKISDWKKGSNVSLVGDLRQEHWEKDGIKRSTYRLTVAKAQNLSLEGKTEETAGNPLTDV